MDYAKLSPQQWVWVRMADHFVDGDAEEDIPFTALACIEAGLSVEQASAIWHDEVEPVLFMHYEWCCWDLDWLFDRLERRRARNHHWLGRFLNFQLFRLNETVWRAIERDMKELLSLTSEQRRAWRLSHTPKYWKKYAS